MTQQAPKERQKVARGKLREERRPWYCSPMNARPEGAQGYCDQEYLCAPPTGRGGLFDVFQGRRTRLRLVLAPGYLLLVPSGRFA